MSPPEEPSIPDEAARMIDLQARVNRLEQELADTRELVREVVAASNTQFAEASRARSELRVLERRRTVRLALAISRRSQPFARVCRALGRAPRRAVRSARGQIRERLRRRRLRASTKSEHEVVAALRQALAPAAVDHGDLVSIVVVDRGDGHLDRCLRAVAATAYRDVEILVVHTRPAEGSTNAGERLALPRAAKVLRTERVRSAADARAEGAAAARGGLLCFLDSNTQPITEHWLGYLVETLTSTGAVAAGARLVSPRQPGGPPAGARDPELTLQHAGVTFDRWEAVPMPRMIGAGTDPLGPAAVAVEDRPALAGACLLVRRQAFEGIRTAAGGSDDDCGDIDLSLRFALAGGRLAYDGRAALWHYGPSGRPGDALDRRAKAAGDPGVFVDEWGPRIFRDAFLDALDGGDRFSSDPFSVAITVMSNDPAAGFGDWYTGHELGEALEGLGWRISYLERAAGGWYDPEPSVEAVIVLLDTCDIRRMPRRLVKMAWVRGWPERWLGRLWFDEYDLVFGSSERIVEMVRDGSAKVATLLPIATNPGRFGQPEGRPDLECDVLFAGSYWNQYRGVVDALPALAEHGFRVHVHGRGWDDIPGFAAIHRGFLGYDEMPRAYASAKIVIDDAAMSTKACGSVNSRVFDAIAAGSIVVSNGALGVWDLFGGSFPTWSDAPTLIQLVEAILARPEEAAEHAAAYRAIVLSEHTYAARARTVREALRAWASATRYGLRIGVPSWEGTERWGDYHFARALQRSLERAGHPTRLHFLPDWRSAVAAREDVTIHLLGLKEAPTRRGQINFLWQISHPDLATPESYDRYDHVFVASDAFAARMAPLTRVPVTSLHQATDPERFRPDRDMSCCSWPTPGTCGGASWTTSRAPRGTWRSSVAAGATS
jgi:O-antigen biosynthesis protein